MRYLQGEVRREDVPRLPAGLRAVYRTPNDNALFAHDHSPPYCLATLHEAARALGIRTGACTLARFDWQNVPCPIIAFDLSAPVAAAASAESVASDDAVVVYETPPANKRIELDFSAMEVANDIEWRKKA